MNKLKKYPLLVMFAVFILGGFVLDVLSPIRNFSELENRYLQQPPAYSWKTLVDNSYSQKYETYINDQFVLRDKWITLKSISEAALGKIENNGVIYGSDGQMFEKNYKVDEKRKQDNIKFLMDFKAKNLDKNIQFMLIPSAYEILTDKTPIGMGNVDQLAIISEIYSEVSKSGMGTIDAAKALAEHKDEYIYYRTDHHWTSLGAYYGYSAVCGSLGITPESLNSFNANTVKGFYGSHFNKAKLFNAVPDEITWYDVELEGVTIDGKGVEGLYDLTKVDTRDKYELFLHGNNGVTVIKTAHSDNKKNNILVIKDSYSNSLVPFLTKNYNTITVVDLRSTGQNLSEIMSKTIFDDVLVAYSFNNFVSDVNIAKISY